MSKTTGETVYLLMEGAYEDRVVRWATLNKSVADAIAASDDTLDVDDIALVSAPPSMVTVLTLSATLSRGAMDERRSESRCWSGDEAVQVSQYGPVVRSIDMRLSWEYILTVSGSDHEQVQDEYDDRLGRLKEQTAIPPRPRPTSDVDPSLWARAAFLLGKPVQEIDLVRVGYDHHAVSAVVVARFRGGDTRVAISDEIADELTTAGAVGDLR
jgi:hypothetical protein